MLSRFLFITATFERLHLSRDLFDMTNKSVEAVYYNYRESEVKHGRFAMTAFLAFFEEADWSAGLHQLGRVKIRDELNGTLGLGEVQAPALLAGLALQAFAEFNLQRVKEDGDVFCRVQERPLPRRPRLRPLWA